MCWHLHGTVRSPAIAYRERRDRELAHRYPQILSRKERTDSQRPRPKSAADITAQSGSTCSALRQKWSAFKISLTIKVRIVMYRMAPYFTLKEYYLSPWYEKSQRKAAEASWMTAWQKMNQPVVLQGMKII